MQNKHILFSHLFCGLFQVVPSVFRFRLALGMSRKRVWTTCGQDLALMLKLHHTHCGLFVCFFSHCSVLLLFDYHLLSVIDIDALGRWLAAEWGAVEGVPVAKGDFARLGVEGADGCLLAVAAYESHVEGLW